MVGPGPRLLPGSRLAGGPAPAAEQGQARPGASPEGPLDLLSRLAAERARVEVWMVDRPEEVLTGVLVGCDALFNLLLEEARFSGLWPRADQELGGRRTLVRGDSVLLVAPVAGLSGL